MSYAQDSLPVKTGLCFDKRVCVLIPLIKVVGSLDSTPPPHPAPPHLSNSRVRVRDT